MDWLLHSVVSYNDTSVYPIGLCIGTYLACKDILKKGTIFQVKAAFACASIALLLLPLVALFGGIFSGIVGIIVNFINGVATGYLMATGYQGISQTKGLYYFICMSV